MYGVVSYPGRRRLVYSASIVPTLLYALDTCPLDKTQYKSLEGHYFRLLRRTLKNKVSYYSRISNYRVWKVAQRPVLPSQHILLQQFKLLVRATTIPPGQPLHHVIFSRGYEDRAKFSKSKPRGHQAKYWYEIVTLIFSTTNCFNTSSEEVTRDVRGIARLLQKDANYGCNLMTAPTRQPALFHMYSQTVGLETHGKLKTLCIYVCKPVYL